MNRAALNILYLSPTEQKFLWGVAKEGNCWEVGYINLHLYGVMPNSYLKWSSQLLLPLAVNIYHPQFLQLLLLSQDFLIFVFPVSTVVLICISLVTNEFVYIVINLFAICVSSAKCMFLSFSSVRNSQCCFSYRLPVQSKPVRQPKSATHLTLCQLSCSYTTSFFLVEPFLLS